MANTESTNITRANSLYVAMLRVDVTWITLTTMSTQLQPDCIPDERDDDEL